MRLTLRQLRSAYRCVQHHGLEVYASHSFSSSLTSSAGLVAAVGSEVTKYQVGDRVMALVDGGGYATCMLSLFGEYLLFSSLRFLQSPFVHC